MSRDHAAAFPTPRDVPRRPLCVLGTVPVPRNVPDIGAVGMPPDLPSRPMRCPPDLPLQPMRCPPRSPFAAREVSSICAQRCPRFAQKIKIKNMKKTIDIFRIRAIIQKLSARQQSENKIWGYSSAGRALEWHSRGQRFDPAYLHHLVLKTIGFQAFFFS